MDNLDGMAKGIESLIPQGLPRKDGQGIITFDEIDERFASTPEAQELARNVRFDPFRPKWLSKPGWVRTLGNDVHNLRHHNHTDELLVAFLKADTEGQFWDEDRLVLRLTARTHDWPEGIRGDTPFHDKTSADNDAEIAILREQHRMVFGDEVDPFYSDKVCEILDDRSRGKKLWKAFATVERMGYLDTALKAWERSQHDELDPRLRMNLTELTWIVTGHIKEVVPKAQLFQGTAAFLRDRADTLNHFFANVPLEFLREVKEDHHPFERTELTWATFRANPYHPSEISSPQQQLSGIA